MVFNKLFVKKKKGSYFVLRIFFAVGLLATLFSSGVYIGIVTVNNFRADYIRQEAESIDHALSIYGLAHQRIDTARMDSKKKIQSEQKPCYPKSLEELGVLQNKFGYLSGLIEFTQTIETNNWGRFRYMPIQDPSTETSGDDEFYSSYVLQVYLPNGHLWTSPGSNGEGK